MVEEVTGDKDTRLAKENEIREGYPDIALGCSAAAVDAGACRRWWTRP